MLKGLTILDSENLLPAGTQSPRRICSATRASSRSSHFIGCRSHKKGASRRSLSCTDGSTLLTPLPSTSACLSSFGLTSAAQSRESRFNYPSEIRRIVYYAADLGRSFVYYTNNFYLPAKDIALLYRYRWQVELFFKWIKQHLRIKRFWGNSENAVRIQVHVAITAKRHLLSRFCPGGAP